MAETKRKPQCRGQQKTRHGEALCVLERGHPGDHYMPALEWRGLSPHVPNRMCRPEAAPEDGCGGPKEACPACDSPKEHESFRCPECRVVWCDECTAKKLRPAPATPPEATATDEEMAEIREYAGLDAAAAAHRSLADDKPAFPGECVSRECCNWPMYHFRTKACPPASPPAAEKDGGPSHG